MSIFISYSRKDADFVHRLHDDLSSRDREIWVDWEGIPPTAEWMKEIEGAVNAAVAFVFVLSPAAAESEVCKRELAYAVAQNKRLIPILFREVNVRQVPPEIAKLNWVFFRPSDDFERALQTLLEAVDTDLDWVQAHTRLLVRSVEWEAKARDASFALHGRDLKSAEQWLTLGPTKTPQPTELQTRYIIDSRRQATHRRFLLLGGAAVSVAIMATLGTLFFLQRQEAARQEAMAVTRRLSTVSEQLRDQPPRPGAKIDPIVLSGQLAAEALRRLDAVGLRSVEADMAMRRALALLPQRIAQLAPLAAPAGRVDDITFGAGGQLVAASKYLSTTAIWDAALQARGGKQGHSSASAVALSADGQFVVTVEQGHLEGSLDVWQSGTLAPVGSLRDLGRISNVAISPGGSFLAATTSDFDRKTQSDINQRTRVWDVPGMREIARLPSTLWLTFSPDGAYLAGVVDRKPAIWRTDELHKAKRSPLAPLKPAVLLADGPLFSPDSSHLAIRYGEDPAKVGIWRLKDWKLVREMTLAQLRALGPEARHIAVVGDESGYVTRIVDTHTEREVARIISEYDYPALAFAPNGRDIAIATEKGIDVWRLPERGSDVMRIASGAQSFALTFSPDEMRLGVLERNGAGPSANVTATTWNLANGGRSTAPLDLGAATLAPALSADGRFMALASAGQVRVIHADTASTRESFALEGTVTALALSPDARYLVAAADRDMLHVWQIDPAKQLGSTTLPKEASSTSSADPLDGNQLVVGRDRVVAVTRGKMSRAGERRSLHVWNDFSMSEVSTRPIGQAGAGAATVCALSADARYVAVNTSENAMTVRETKTGRDVGIINDAGGVCAFSADARYLAAAGSGETVRVWDVAAQTEIARIDGLAQVRSLSFSPRGRYLATLQRDGTAQVWLLRYDDLLAQACARLSANLSADDWERYLGAQPYWPACPQLPVTK